MNEIDIKELDHRQASIAADIHLVMMAAYPIEAGLLAVSDFPPLHRTQEQITGAESSFTGAFVKAQLAAVIEIEPVQPGMIDIAALVVLPSHFRSGLGTALVRHVIQAQGGGKSRVSTAARNTPALELYKRMNFSENRRWQTPDGIPMIELIR